MNHPIDIIYCVYTSCKSYKVIYIFLSTEPRKHHNINILVKADIILFSVPVKMTYLGNIVNGFVGVSYNGQIYSVSHRVSRRNIQHNKIYPVSKSRKPFFSRAHDFPDRTTLTVT